MSAGAWDAMLRWEQAERERAAGISSVAGLAALRAGARQAGLLLGQTPMPDREDRPDEDEFAPGECDGSGTCSAPIHVHGCYTPHRSDECDSPDEYGHTDREICGAELNADSRPCQSERGHSGDHWTPSDQAGKPMWWSTTDREIRP